MKKLIHALAILATLTIALSTPNRVLAEGPDPWPRSTICLPLICH